MRNWGLYAAIISVFHSRARRDIFSRIPLLCFGMAASPDNSSLPILSHKRNHNKYIEAFEM